MMISKKRMLSSFGGYDMAIKRIKLTPAGILFLIAIGVLLIALISVIIVLSTTCSGERDANRANPSETLSAEPSEEATPDSALAETAAPDEDTPEPLASEETPGPSGLDPLSTSESTDSSGGIVITTPDVTPATSPSSTEKIYTSPTSAQKKNAKDGYLVKDSVNMRKGPGTNYSVVKKGLSKNTSVTLYELQGDWWFVKCNNTYGYIRKDMIKEGKLSTAKATEKASGTYEGTIKVNSVAALRKSADKSSKCLKELKNGAKVTVYYKVKDKSGNYWYYVASGKTKGYVKASLVSTSSKVPTK